jgi:metabolite-proton symporter
LQNLMPCLCEEDKAQMGISTSRIAFATFVGTTIEFFDFYVYGLAVAMVIGPAFFPGSEPALQALNAFLTFGIAFVARPIGAVVFGHFGDRVGRKATLVWSLLTMGISTTMVGLLPSYDQIGAAAPTILCLLRFGQGIGLGGEWAGAALLATEYAPDGKRGWFSMFPQLGPPSGFLLATASFLLLSHFLDDSQFRSWGWRLPFIASSALVILGLYVRIQLAETPVFTNGSRRRQTAALPVSELLHGHATPLLVGSAAMVVCYALFYVTTVFALSYGVANLGIPRERFLLMLCLACIFMAVATPLSARASDLFGRRPILLCAGGATFASGFLLSPMLGSGSEWQVTTFVCLELFLMGATFAPMGAFLPELFPTTVRYTGAGASYNLGGILGASLAPYIAQKLVMHGGLPWVGGYVSAAAALSLLAIMAAPETRHRKLE